MLLISAMPPRLTEDLNSSVEIEVLPAPPLASILEKNNRKMVRATTVPKSLLTQVDKTTDLTSKDFQRVVKEMRALEDGITQNRLDDRPALPSSSTSTRQRQPAQNSEKDPNSELKSRSTDVAEELKNWNQLAGGGASTFGEAIDRDIPFGSITALNTDRNTFYSFYARVEELTRYRWEKNFYRAIERLPNEGIEYLNTKNFWTTQLEFLLTPSGELSSVLLLKESGLQEFDQAAIEAFKEARIFPNPPKELVQSDGFIHLRYSFRIRWNPVRLAQPQR